jgi:hypothetical protein
MLGDKHHTSTSEKPAASSSASSTGSLAAIALQQVEESGLLHDLPAMMAAVQSALTASTQQNEGMPAAAGHVTAERLQSALVMAQLLLGVQRQLLDLWAPVANSINNDIALSPSLASALELGHTVFQCVGGLLGEVSAQSAGYADKKQYLDGMFSLQDAAQGFVLRVIHHLGEPQSSSDSYAGLHPWQKQLLASPHLLHCVGSAVTALALAPAMQQKARPVSGSRGSSRSSTTQDSTSGHAGATRPQHVPSACSSTPGTTDGIQASHANWKQARHQARQLSTCQLKLCELLGVNARVLLWYAHTAGFQWDEVASGVCRAACTLARSNLVKTYEVHKSRIERSNKLQQLLADLMEGAIAGSSRFPTVSEIQAGQRFLVLPPHHTNTQWQFECRLHLLLPTVLLPCATNPNSHILVFEHALHASMHCLTGYNAMVSAAATASIGSTASSVPLPQVPDLWVCEVLPLVLQLTDHWLQHAATDMGSPAPSSAAARSRPCQQSAAQEAAAVLLRMLCWVLQHCRPGQLQAGSLAGDMQLAGDTQAEQTAAAAVTAVNADTNADLAAALGSPKTPSQRQLLLDYRPPRGQHLAQLLFRFEQFLRLLSTTDRLSGSLTENAPSLLRELCHLISGPLLEPAFAAAPDSLEHQQLHSLLNSLLKLQRTDVLRQKWSCDIAGVLPACVAVVSRILHGLRAQAESEYLNASLHTKPNDSSAAGSNGSPTSSISGHVSNIPHTADSAVCHVPADPVMRVSSNAFPALVMLGRCCLALSDLLHQEAFAMLDTLTNASGLGHMGTQQWAPRTAASVCFQRQQHTDLTLLDVALLGALRVVKELTLASSTHDDGTAQAHYLGIICKQQGSDICVALCSLITTAAECRSDLEAAAAIHSLRQGLQATGLALTALPVEGACNSPSCTNMAGPSDLLTVSGRSCVCGGCRVARYCSRACQRQHWKQHKPVCAALTATAAAAAAPVV